MFLIYSTAIAIAGNSLDFITDGLFLGLSPQVYLSTPNMFDQVFKILYHILYSNQLLGSIVVPLHQVQGSGRDKFSCWCSPPIKVSTLVSALKIKFRCWYFPLIEVSTLVSAFHRLQVGQLLSRPPLSILPFHSLKVLYLCFKGNVWTQCNTIQLSQLLWVLGLPPNNYTSFRKQCLEITKKQFE